LKRHVLSSTMLAGAALMLCLQAQALTLGRLQVLSGLGEPLRAEIEVNDLNAADIAGLRLLALPATAYSTLSQQNNALASAFEITLVSGPGAPRLLLSSRQVMDAPFVDFVIEASWPAGRSVREYTALFNEKPNTASAAPSTTVPDVTSPEVALNTSPTANFNAANKASNSGGPVATTEGRSHVVKAGETAGKIAQTHTGKDITLDQMLLALLRENPQAFIGGNVNQLRAGSVLQIPQAQVAQSVAPAEALKLIKLQHSEFETLRQRIAQTAPAREVPSANRESAGQVTVPVQTAAAPAADKLTLSQSDVAAQDGAAKKEQAPDQLAKDLQTRDVQSENLKTATNLDELQKLSDEAAATAKVAPAPATQTSASSTAPETKPADAINTKPEGSAAEAPAGLPGQNTDQDTNKDTAQATPPPSGLIDHLIALPWVPAMAAGLLAVLGSLAVYRVRQRRKQGEPEPSAQSKDAVVTGNTPEPVELSAPWQAAAPEDDPSSAPMSALPAGLPDLNLDVDVPASSKDLMADLPDLDLPQLDNDNLSLSQPSSASATSDAQTQNPVQDTAQVSPEQDLSDDEPLDANTPVAHTPMNLDLGGLSLDLDVPDLSASDPTSSPSDNEAMSNKLALAKEFVAMGDKEGARALVDEVLANSSGEVRAQAESLLFELA
jgi:pilus assembly protein FimV